MARGAELPESERRSSEKPALLLVRTLVPACFGAALLAGLYSPLDISWPLGAVVLAAFLGHFVWRVGSLAKGDQASELEWVEVGLLSMLALSTALRLSDFPWPEAAFGILLVSLAAVVPLPGILALPLATLLVGTSGADWRTALVGRLPSLAHLVLLAAAAGAVVAAEKRRSWRLRVALEKLRLDAEHMGTRAEGIGAEKRGDLSRLDDVLYTYLQKVKEYAGAHAAVLATLKSSSKGDLYIRELVSDSHSIREERVLSLEANTFQWVLKNRKELRIGHLADSGKLGYYKGSVAVRSFLGVPLAEGEDVRGVLALDSLREDAFNEAHVTMLRVAAHQVSTILEQTREFQQKKREARDFESLHEFSKRIGGCSSLPELLNLALHSIAERTQPDFSAAALTGAEGNLTIETVGSEKWDGLRGRTFGPDEGLAGWVLSGGPYLHYEEGQPRRPLFSDDVKLPQFQSLLVYPLEAHGEALGMLCLGASSPHAFDLSARKFCEIVSQQTAQALLQIRYLERLEHLATTDGLTGLTNRRSFLERMAEEVRRSRRYPQGLALLLLDVDHFKKINDKHGHPAGDEVLREVSKALRGFARDTDLVARYGGEEFALLLPGTEEPGARAVAERIRLGIEGRKVAWEGKGIPVKVSLGVTVLEGEKDSPEAMISRADRCLYEAKETGRNRVIAYGEIREYESWR